MVNAGRCPIVEPGLDEVLRRGVAAGRIRATTDATDAVAASEVSIVCVGTPSAANGSLDLTQVEKVCQEIGLALSAAPERHTVIVRSTMLPGSTDAVVIPALEQASGTVAGEGFRVLYNPEFLREGSSLADFADPAFTLLGAEDEATAEVGRALYETLTAPVIVAPIRVAEMVKYAANAFHATKITFANEIGSVASALGVDGREVMRDPHPRHQAQRLPGLPPPGVRLRWLVPAQGPAGPHPPGPHGRRRDPACWTRCCAVTPGRSSEPSR